MTASTVQVNRVWIKATPQAVWDAITSTDWNGRYGYECPGHYDLRPGGEYRVTASDAMKEHGAPDVIIDDEVLESDPPHKLVQTWRANFSPESAAEGYTKLTWEIVEEYGSVRLTVTHELTGAPIAAAQVAGDIPGAGGGWAYIVSDIKTLLETGKSLAGATAP
ncbi:SRPBCC domain-containing protein [Umezawaea sp. NPDC059074]|uniref:SRPBCC domain-containing protein n=1 Tax=Umezawaea sp. NPDC059074 TaxID=3346716 RepID=UPI0036CB3010